MEIMMRRAKMADAAAINALWNRQAGGEGRLEIDQRPVEYHQEWLAAHDRRHPVFVGSLEGEAVCWAALGYGSPEGYPFDGVASVELGLPEDLSGSELTDLLLHFLEQQALRLGYYKLTAAIPAGQRYLLHAYRRAGFRDVGTLRSHGYCRGRLVDMSLMERLLPPNLPALEEYYSRRYPFYEEYFQEERRRKEDAATENQSLEYEEVAAPEGQLPEGIVRFLRTKRDENGRPVRRQAPPPEEAREPLQDEERDSQAPEKNAGVPGLPEGIVRFLKSKKRPDGTPLDPELPPVVPVKVAPIAGQTMSVAAQEEEGEEPPVESPEIPGLAVSPEDPEDDPNQLRFDDIVKP